MSLSRTQKLVRLFSSRERFAAMERESRDWIVEGSCGFRSTVWDMGGIRYKAASKGRATFGRCPSCGKRHGFKVHKA